MIKIMLACSAGMSTSLLVTKMESAAKENGIESQI
ncbi:PTS sugar transporter subunit IIB, partial [Clostridioides difficile]|nr:PTS sugar transporter subunit IIB [Clostridioides difficile]